MSTGSSERWQPLALTLRYKPMPQSAEAAVVHTSVIRLGWTSGVLLTVRTRCRCAHLLECAPRIWLIPRVQAVLFSGAVATASSQPVSFIVQSPAVSFTERVQSLPAANTPIGARAAVYCVQRLLFFYIYFALSTGDANDVANVTFVTAALDIGRRHASHSFDDDYVQNLRHLLFLRVKPPVVYLPIITHKR